MKPRYILLIMMVALSVASCSLLQAQPDPQVQATPMPAEAPRPVSYDYEYEIVDTRANCGPDGATFLELGSVYIYSSQEEVNKAAAKAAAIILCTRVQLQSDISQRGADGWRLVAFEALQPGQYDFGIEYTYRLVWERSRQ